jgi:hypothetical protein
MDCLNCKNNIAKGCNIEYNQTREKLCDKEVTKEGCLR